MANIWDTHMALPRPFCKIGAHIWTQEQHAKGMEVWAAIKRHPKALITNLDPITREDLERSLKMLNTNTAVGIDQCSPAQLRLLDDTGKG